MNASMFFICGPHACGKTTVLKRLKQDKNIVFRGTEVGKDLYYERKFQTGEVGEDFELEVVELELKRDAEIYSQPGIAGVETWHPGNLAYAAVRNPRILPTLQKMILTSPMLERAFGIWLVIDNSEMRKRTQTFRGQEDFAGEFYGKINDQLENCFKMLGLWERTTIIDGNRPIEAVIQNVKDVMQKYKA
ncbi:MAG: hypothetical protein FWG66_03660 [Spirochaetes bacterium]|nr:hypothetical protein [Spirochaetota bacterium]